MLNIASLNGASGEVVDVVSAPTYDVRQEIAGGDDISARISALEMSWLECNKLLFEVKRKKSL